MVGRSLLSHFAVVAVVVQSSFASVIDSTFNIGLSLGYVLTASGTSPEAVTVEELKRNGRSQDWTIERNEDDTAVIRNVESRLYLAPSSPPPLTRRE